MRSLSTSTSKRTTQLKKLMDAYVAKTGVDPTAIRFLYEGQRLQPGQTPDELSMEDEDIIQTAVEQVGGR
ncbi:SMT3 suppressor of mif two 3-like 1 [Hyaloraphidium curvatum]|nr:SMT3 suppressor of mif two 3-like 1 [Hyaloraphidium curvatum]